MWLEEYKDQVALFGNVLQLCQMFSPLFVCKDIYQRKSSNHLFPMTFLNGLLMCCLMFEQTRLLKDKNLGGVFYIGMIVNLITNSTYFIYSHGERRQQYVRSLLKVIAFLTVVIGYAELENPEKVVWRYGMILMAFMVFMMLFPMLQVPKIVREKNSDSLPFPMICCAFFMSGTWLLYGILSKTPTMIYQNGFIFPLMGFFLALCLMYPAKKTTKKEDEKEEKKKE